MLRHPLAIVVLVIASLGLFILGLNALFPGAFSWADQGPDLVHSVAWVVLLASALVAGGLGGIRESLRYAAIWIAIIAALVLGYSFRHDMADLGQRFRVALLPSSAVEEADGVMAVGKSSNGHFMVRATVTGPDLTQADILFLVDTGASRVSLTRADARRLGIDPDTLAYTGIVNTANGRAQTAPVRLPRIALGSIEVGEVAAHVASDGLNVSLLGNSFLDALSSFSVERDRLVLRQ